MQDNEGNTAAHLAVAGPPRDPENPYSNELEDIFNRQHMDRLAYLELDPANIIQVVHLFNKHVFSLYLIVYDIYKW